MLKLTQKAIDKLAELTQQSEQNDRKPLAVRIGVKGGGCSGFQYNMEFITDESGKLLLDKVLNLTGSGGQNLEIRVDPASILYLENCEVDYVETLEAAGFKFNNPNIKSTCGCGTSFSA